MTSSSKNPFVLPGFGQDSELGQNPLLAGMEMMRQAWQNMAGAGVLGQSDVTHPVTLQDLDRRIADLRAIENWLQMNMSMLANTIQGLQVQRSTIATLTSFMGMPGTHTPADNPSPLEVALGIKPAGQAKIKPAQGDADEAAAAEPADADDATTAAAGFMASPEAAQNWWNMMQQQFGTLAAATAATMQASQAAQAEAMAAAAEAAGIQQADEPEPPGQAKIRPATKAKAKKAAPRAAAARKTSSARKSGGTSGTK